MAPTVRVMAGHKAAGAVASAAVGVGLLMGGVVPGVADQPPTAVNVDRPTPKERPTPGTRPDPRCDRAEQGFAIAKANVAKADGDRKVLELTGQGEAAKIQAIGAAQGEAEKALGLGKAAGYQAQKDAIGAGQTAAVAVVDALSKSQTPFMPQTLITSGGGDMGGLLQLVLANLATGQKPVQHEVPFDDAPVLTSQSSTESNPDDVES